MRAEELQVGDWVHCITSGENLRIYRLNVSDRWIGDSGLYTDELDRLNLLSDVEGIEISEKILNQNFFRNGIYEDLYGHKVVVKENKSIEIFLDSERLLYLTYNRLCVHRLQQALRLCGLDEMAKNLKV